MPEHERLGAQGSGGPSEGCTRGAERGERATASERIEQCHDRDHRQEPVPDRAGRRVVHRLVHTFSPGRRTEIPPGPGDDTWLIDPRGEAGRRSTEGNA